MKLLLPCLTYFDDWTYLRTLLHRYKHELDQSSGLTDFYWRKTRVFASFEHPDIKSEFGSYTFCSLTDPSFGDQVNRKLNRFYPAKSGFWRVTMILMADLHSTQNLESCRIVFRSTSWLQRVWDAKIEKFRHTKCRNVWKSSHVLECREL